MHDSHYKFGQAIFKFIKGKMSLFFIFKTIFCSMEESAPVCILYSFQSQASPVIDISFYLVTFNLHFYIESAKNLKG